MDRKIIAVLSILILILGVVGISGCTSSDNYKQTPSNSSNSSYATPEPINITSSDTNVKEANSTSNDYSSSSNDKGVSGPSSASAAYVANSNTGKFHYADCYWVTRMSASHKVYYDSREDAIRDGYVPCKVCDP